MYGNPYQVQKRGQMYGNLYQAQKNVKNITFLLFRHNSVNFEARTSRLPMEVDRETPIFPIGYFFDNEIPNLVQMFLLAFPFLEVQDNIFLMQFLSKELPFQWSSSSLYQYDRCSRIYISTNIGTDSTGLMADRVFRRVKHIQI